MHARCEHVLDPVLGHNSHGHNSQNANRPTSAKTISWNFSCYPPYFLVPLFWSCSQVNSTFSSSDLKKWIMVASKLDCANNPSPLHQTIGLQYFSIDSSDIFANCFNVKQLMLSSSPFLVTSKIRRGWFSSDWSCIACNVVLIKWRQTCIIDVKELRNTIENLRKGYGNLITEFLTCIVPRPSLL